MDGVLIISGIPGSGKTTVSRILAARFQRGVHIEGDLIGHHFIVSGLVPPQGPPAEEAERQLRLRRRNICLLADSFTDAGFATIVDDVVVSASVLDAYTDFLQARPLRLVQLVPRLEVIATRDAGRDKHVFDLWKHLHEISTSGWTASVCGSTHPKWMPTKQLMRSSSASTTHW